MIFEKVEQNLHLRTRGITLSDSTTKHLAEANTEGTNKSLVLRLASIGFASSIVASSAFFSTACSQSPETTQNKSVTTNNDSELKKRADSLVDNGEPETAIAVLTTLLQQSPKDGNALYSRGRCYLEIDKPKEARADFDLANEYQPNNTWYRSWGRSPSDHEYDLSHRAKPVAREWAIACSALLFASNGDGLHSLSGQELTEANKSDQARVIYDWWRIKTREDLFAQLQALNNNDAYNSLWQSYMKVKAGKIKPEEIPDVAADLKTGKFPERMAIVNEYGDEFGERGINAWDLCRYISLVRWGYLLGFVNENEAYDLIMPVAIKIQKQYSSWKQMNDEYLIGRKFWAFSQWKRDEAKSNRVTKCLLSVKTSPWVALPWKTKLD
ncbi:hypothetical protein BH11CYA1_BH11CYA1_50560 [soil metagenome]